MLTTLEFACRLASINAFPYTFIVVDTCACRIKLLLHAYRCSGNIQPRAVGVTEGVPPDPSQSQRLARRPSVILLNRAGVVGTSGQRAQEDRPVVGAWALGSPIDQHLCEAGVQRKFIFRVLRFHAFDATVNDAAGDLDRFPFEIKICWSALVAVRLHSWTIGTSDACTTRPDLWVHNSGIKPVARGVSCPMLSGLNLSSAALACSCCSRTRKQIRRPHSMTKPFKLNIWPIPTKNIEIIKYRNIEA